MTLLLVSGAGNRFAVADSFRHAPEANPARLSASLAGRVDGLLLLDPAENGIRMTLYNADGSRAEACGNGLRCVAAIAVEQEYVRGPNVLVHTDAGPRWVEVEVKGGVAASATADMGALNLGQPFSFELEGHHLQVFPVHVGNPHAVAFVETVDDTPLGVIGPVLERHARFPHRANVEIASLAPDGGVEARVWERGVGVTPACGTGACAVAVASSMGLGLRSPVRVDMPGGSLFVSWTSLESIRLQGPVQREGTIEP